MLKYPLTPLIWSPVGLIELGNPIKKDLGTKTSVSMLPFKKKRVVYLNSRIFFLAYIKNIKPYLLKFKGGGGSFKNWGKSLAKNKH